MITIIYDGECPLCDHYITRLRLVETFGAVELVDARAQSAVTQKYWAQGYNIDEGMIVVVDGAVYHGADAAALLARLSANDGLFDRIYHWTLSHGALAKLAYPLLKACRRIALRMTGRRGLANPVNSTDPPDR